MVLGLVDIQTISIAVGSDEMKRRQQISDKTGRHDIVVRADDVATGCYSLGWLAKNVVM
jgi:hypothetical protein